MSITVFFFEKAHIFSLYPGIVDGRIVTRKLCFKGAPGFSRYPRFSEVYSIKNGLKC